MSRVLAQIAGTIATILGHDGTDFQNIKTDTDGHPQVDVLSNALPTDAATETTLALVKTAAESLTDLLHALHSVNTDEFKVRGEDQLPSYKESLVSTVTGAVSGAGGYLDSPAPAAGLVWKVTNVHTTDVTSATAAHTYMVQRGAASYRFWAEVSALAAGARSFYRGEVWLEPADTIRVIYAGSKAADSCMIDLTGVVMTKHT